MSIVVAYEGSLGGRRTLVEAAREASLRQTSLTVVHVAEGVDVELIEAQTSRLRAEVGAVLAEAEVSGLEWTLQVPTGIDVAETILELVADSGAGLVVIGARRRSRVGKLLLGSVSQTVVRQAEVPILVVPPA